MVQALPSLQDVVLFVCTQPVAELQLSSVHTLSSLQFFGPPAWQLPPAHVSPTVQMFPSSHGDVLFMWRHPTTASQLSFVHGLLSLQLVNAPPAQVPVAVQASLVVHAFPSLHDAPGALVGLLQEPGRIQGMDGLLKHLPGVQVSPGGQTPVGMHVPTSWQPSSAEQTTGFEPTQTPD
jgi:hypothetical protein